METEAQRQIVDRLKISFFDYYRYQPSESEQKSWHHSLHALAAQIKRTKLFDHGLILEMQLPLTSKRLDCILTGHSATDSPAAVLVELKQWTDAAPADEDKCVMVNFGPGTKVLQHPSYQAKYYADYLRDYRVVFYEEPAVPLSPCAWLHNFQRDPDSTLLDIEKFGDVLAEAPLFAGSDADAFGNFLLGHLERGGGASVLERIVQSRFAPSRKLMEHTASVIKGDPVYVLLDEQRVAYERIMLAARRSRRGGKRCVIIVEGGPGTGKSVIALNVMADLLGTGRNVQHATGSKAFTENLRKALGTRAGTQFRYFNSFVDADEGEVDVLICDESHRIRETSNNRYTPSAKRSQYLQIEELVKASKVAVFFIDDQQVVRPGEVGSTRFIEDTALELGAKVVREKLVAQFRCAGSDEYIDWIDDTLGLRETESSEFELGSGFDFKIVDSPFELEDEIRERVQTGSSGRISAGFCWKWSKPKDGLLVDDVVIGEYRRPWNAQPDAVRLPPGVPKSNYWATDPRGIEQIGCVYTAQGFEFDYIGVIWGTDLVYRAEQGGWVGQKTSSYDAQVKRARDGQFADLVKNTYRVLLTRGLKGCYIYFMDRETREHFESRLISQKDIAGGPRFSESERGLPDR
ncbi:MAG TPA: DUF2075 domain-containing protein [Candidatus Baltobacteraceae bacterium]|nr:DUF2075 domain-containing protein [Candidatus Baltobacteraceae bacterium]